MRPTAWSSCAVRLGLLALLLGVPAAAFAQLGVMPDPPLPGRLRLGDLWNATLTNPGPAAQSASLRVRVRRESGELALEAQSGAIEFAAGARRVSSRDLGSIEVTQTGAGVEEALSRSGAFPDGRYTVCLEALDAGGASLGPAACVDVEIATVMPPQPIEPPNGGTTSQPFILWTWFMQPATAAGEAVSCDLRVVEVLSGQTPEEALRNNPAVILREGLRTSTWQTNEAVRSLHHGSTYAWRLTARVAGRVTSESEIWTFTYLSPEVDQAAPAANAPVPPPAPAGPKPVEWRAVARTTVESSNRPGTLSQSEARYARLEIDPTLAIYGSPLALSLLVSTEHDPHRSELERGSLSLDGASRAAGIGLYQRIDGRVSALQKSRTELLADSARLARDDLDRVQSELAQLQALRPLDPSQSAAELQQLGLVTPGEATTLRIPAFAFGSVAPDFGRLMLNGVTVNGGMIEHDPGRIYGALAVGKLPRADTLGVPPPPNADGTRPELFQDLYSARLGLGRKNGDHLILSGLYAKDDRQSRSILALADPSHPPPVQENVVVGLAARTVRGGGKLVLDGDAQASVFTDDRGAPALLNRPAPAALRSLFGGRIRESSASDWAGGLRGSFELASLGAKLTSGVRFVGPGYATLGVRGLRRDNLQYDGAWDQSWSDHRYSFGAFWGNDRTGVVLPQTGFASTSRVGARIAGRPAKLPAMEVAWSLNGQRQHPGNVEREIQSRVQLVSARLRQSGHLGKTRSTTMLSADRLLGSSNDPTADNQSTSVQATQMVSLPSRVGLVARASRSRTVTAIADGRDPDVWSWEGSGTWAPGTWLDANAGVTGAHGTGLEQRGGFLGARVTLGHLGAIDLQWSLNDARAVSPGARGFIDRIFRVQFLTRGATGVTPAP